MMNKLIMKNQNIPYSVDEALKVLRTNIQFCGIDKKVLLITSCVEGEGKSLISLNLSYSFAKLNKKVLLIDMDLRKSVLGEKVRRGRVESGLSHYLSGQCEVDQIVHETENFYLHMILAGAIPANPSEILAGERTKQLLEWARQNYDYVILDCAPLGLVIDAAVVAPHCDGSILVVAAGEVDYHLGQEVEQRLRSAKAPVLGAVLNKVDNVSAKKYYGKRYAGYYKQNSEGYYAI